MIEIDLIKGYAFPENLRELDLRRYIEVTNLESNKPKALDKDFDKLPEVQQIECLTYVKDVIKQLGGKLSKEKISGTVPDKALSILTTADIVYLYGVLIDVDFELEEDKSFRSFNLKGEEFTLEIKYFRDDLVLDLPFGDYATAVQSRANYLKNKDNKNHWEIFPELMAILCEPKKEGSFFLDTNMQDVMMVSFFLNRQALTLLGNTKTSTSNNKLKPLNRKARRVAVKQNA